MRSARCLAAGLVPALLLAAPYAARATSAAVPVPGAPGHLQGRVTRSDGTPVTRFTVNGVRFEDPRGAFEVLVPPMGDFRMVIRSEGFAPTVIHVAGASGKKLTLPEIYLGSGEDLVGEVLDADTGEPVVEARVALADPPQIDRLRLVRPERLSPAVATGFGGIFEIRAAPRGRLLLVVIHPDYLPEFVAVNTREERPTVRLHRGGAIAGTVRGAQGEPLAGATVTAISDVVNDAQEGRTDAQGRFQLSGLRAGEYVVLARAPGPHGALQPQPVAVSDGRVASVGFLARGTRLRMDLPDVDVSPARAEARAPAGGSMAVR